MIEKILCTDEVFELISFEVESSCVAEDSVSERLYSIKPPGKGDSGMAHEQ